MSRELSRAQSDLTEWQELCEAKEGALDLCETARAALEAETQTLGAQLSARQEEADKLKSQVSVLNNMRVEAHQQLLAKGREVESAQYDMAAERARLEEERFASFQEEI